ncbi:hypothetical protein GCM10027040_22820 [Halomonas shantousis]
MSTLLGKPGELGSLMRVADLLDRAQSHLRTHLPEEVREHVFVGGYRDGRLTLITDRAVWLTWLRYEQTRLLALLRQLPELEAVLGITLKVRPVRPVKAPLRQPRQLSSEAADQLEACAADVDDPRLKRALSRLAAHGRVSSSQQ